MALSLFARLHRRHVPQPTPLERREFLRLALAASAGLLVSPGSALARAGRGRRVIVVGAGFAGLACAHELRAAGCEVVVLEARSRIGGRVLSFTDFLPDRAVEGGGELIGRNHPMWLAFARKFGLTLDDLPEEEGLAPVVLDGRRLAARETKALFAELHAAQAAMTRAAAAIDAEQPWRSPQATQLDARPLEDWIRAQPASEMARRALTVEFAANNGVATARQSFLGNLAAVKGGGLERYWTETELYRCHGGNAQLAQKLAHSLGTQLHTGTAVREITQNENGVTVRDASGHLWKGDDVVLAVPPSTWRHLRISPPLPPALRPQMGVNVKFLAKVKRRFWRDTAASPQALSDGLASMIWEGAVSADAAVLTCFSGGPAAAQARRSYAQRRERDYVEALESIFPGFGQNFVSGRFLDWPGERWTGGGYSFPAPGEVTTIGPIVRAGLGRLHFAGEHACPPFVGYMEGALHSGVALAQRLVRRAKAA